MINCRGSLLLCLWVLAQSHVISAIENKNTTAVLKAGAVSAEKVIYQEDFDGPSGENLNDKVPDTAPEGIRWESMKGEAVWMADGTINAQEINQNRNVFLPFIPETGKVYSFTLDIKVDGTEKEGFIGMGFASDNALSDAYVSTEKMKVSPWMFFAGSSVRTYTGPGNAGNTGTVPPKDGWGGKISAEIKLDTVTDPWTVEWLVNGASVRSHKFYAGNPDIKFVTFGRFRRASGGVDNFKLSVAEPAPAAN